MNELAVRDNEDVFRLGEVFAQSGMFAGANSAPKVIVQILAGREMGIGPFSAVTGIHIISGKPTVGAGLMASKVKASAKYDYRVLQHTDEVCEIAFYERVRGELKEIGKSKFTKSDATRAGTQNMQKFSRNMLFARAMSNGVKWYTPDVFMTAVYVPEEMGEVEEEVVDGGVVEEASLSHVEYENLREEATELGIKTKDMPPNLSADKAETWVKKLKEEIAKKKPPEEKTAFTKAFEARVEEAKVGDPEGEKVFDAGEDKVTEKPKPNRYAALFATCAEKGLDTNNQAAMVEAINKHFEGTQFAPITTRKDLTTPQMALCVEAIKQGALTW